ncbi:MAG TPA: FAD-linked oxidase C-terminal domain-containing protein, partial [Nitrososphaerales archaeon]|nr:FAD-linked oxidase C-terminal domain-containing protein [Nitrososphaerales archaeon]
REKGYYVNTVAIPYYDDTLGGMISGVIGGGYPLYSSSFGLDNKDILGLKVVLPTGRIIETNGRGVNVTSKHLYPFMRETGSPDMTGMFIGDGGLFGIKTEATLAFHQIPPHWASGAWLFSNFENAYAAMYDFSKSPEGLCDYLTILSPEITEIYTSKGNPDKSWGLVYYVQGFDRSEIHTKFSGAHLGFQKRGSTLDMGGLNEFSKGMRTGEAYWKKNQYSETLRKRASCAFFASSETFPNLFQQLYSNLKSRAERSESYFKKKLSTSCVIHLVVRNCVWANLILNYESDEDSSVAYEIIRDVHRLGANLGATFEAHGGYAADLMGANWSNNFREMMLSIKRALDPNDILNPGLWFSEI